MYCSFKHIHTLLVLKGTFQRETNWLHIVKNQVKVGRNEGTLQIYNNLNILEVA